MNTGYNCYININRYIQIRDSAANMYSASYKKERLTTILEPLQAMVQLALLSFAPIGSKVSIYENLLSIQLSTWSQAILRNYYNDKKDDLYYLFSVINRFNKFYVNKQAGDTQKNLFALLNDMAYIGIHNLVQTYSANINITNTLNMYKSMIKNPSLCEAYEKEKHDMLGLNPPDNSNSNERPSNSRKDKKRTSGEDSSVSEDSNIDTTITTRTRTTSSTNQIDDLFINIKSLYKDYHYEILYNFLLMVKNDELQYQSYIDGINMVFNPLNAEIKSWINNNLSC